jgi:hypothetical protein
VPPPRFPGTGTWILTQSERKLCTDLPSNHTRLESHGCDRVGQIRFTHGNRNDLVIVGLADKILQTHLVRCVHDDEIVAGGEPFLREGRMFMMER